MLLITCQHKDCPTPHFYVDPGGGKIALHTALNTSDIQEAIIPPRKTNKDQKVDEFLKSIEEELEGLTPEEVESIKNKLYDLIPSEPISTLPKIKTIQDATDYLVVQCQSKHKNYIVLEKNQDNQKLDLP